MMFFSRNVNVLNIQGMTFPLGPQPCCRGHVEDPDSKKVETIISGTM